MINSLFRPRLACQVNFYSEQIVFTQGDHYMSLAIEAKASGALEKLFLMMDGTQTLGELQQQFFPQNPEPLHKIIGDLDQQGLIDDATQLQLNSGSDTVRELEALAAKLIAQPATQKLFWQKVATTEEELEIKVLTGWMREYYFYLTQQCCFDSAVLSFSSSSKIRQLISQRYCRQQEQDAMLLEALDALDISQRELRDTIIPLPQTAALVNGLTYWANFEPLFFLTTLESLTKQKLSNLQSCLQIGKQMESALTVVEPIQRLHDITLEQEPQNLTNLIFAEISHLEAETKQRWQGQIYLLGEIQDNFYRAIWDYYSSARNSRPRVEVS